MGDCGNKCGSMGNLFNDILDKRKVYIVVCIYNIKNKSRAIWGGPN